MAIPTSGPNVTIEDLLSAQEALISAVSGVGSVITRERYVEGENFIAIFTGLNSDGSPNGVSITFQELLEQKKGPRVCSVQMRLRFGYEIIHEFNDKLSDGRTSHDTFLELIQNINNALNKVVGKAQPWNLGITIEKSDVEHQFLQGDGPIELRTWGTGSTAVSTHYMRATLDVLCVVCNYVQDSGS